VPPAVTIFASRYFDDDQVVVGVEIVMALRAPSQYINLLSRISPALCGTLPQKHVFGISASRAAVMGTTRRHDVHPVMHLHKGQLVECNAIE